MKMLNKLIFLLAFVVFYLNTTNADVDCNKHPEHVDFGTCCKAPKLITDDVKAKCKEFEMPASANGHPHPSPCFLSCILNSTNILVNEVLNDANMRSYVQTTLSSAPAMIPIVQESFQNCATKVSENNNQRQFPMPPQCPTKAMRLIGCVKKTSFINCPTSLWNGSQQCNNMREHMTNCKPQKGSMERSMG